MKAIAKGAVVASAGASLLAGSSGQELNLVLQE
jgi:hypothetical protein